MKSFAEKIKDARNELGITQTQLAKACGITSRAVQTYEMGEKRPHKSTLIKLAKELKVSIRFLEEDECEDPMADIEKDGYISEARRLYGTTGERDMKDLLNWNRALFAGGEISDDQKDEFFQAIMAAYLACKEEAKKRYGKKNPDDGN